MPKGARGSRGKSRGPSNRISIGFRIVQAPPGTTREDVKQVLTHSILGDYSLPNGQYSLPEGWLVDVGWANGDNDTKWDEWQNAMIDSSTYSRGWDKLMLRRLENY